MKKKLMTALIVITLIFITSGIFILKNLDVITANQKLKEHQEEVGDRYHDILYAMMEAQAELYRHEAGFSRDINPLVNSVLAIEDMLRGIRNDFSGLTIKTSCNSCHPVQRNVATLDKKIDTVSLLFARYKENIDRIVTTSDYNLSKSLTVNAAKDSKEIIDTINSIRHAALKMNENLEESQLSTLKRATYSIIAAVVGSVLFSMLILIFAMRSITGPVLKLVRGIENVAYGKYSEKVDIVSDDEIGFIAKTFNTMTDNLNLATQQKESLMQELWDLNKDLESRIEEAKEELRITHEKMLRSETLSAVGTLASGVAHELATPISTIINYFEIIKGKLSAQDAEDAKIIESELRRCRNILRGMLSFAREPDKDKSLTDVNTIICDILALVKYQTEYRKVSLTTDLDSGLPGIMAVSGQMQQVFINIIMNALQAMPDGGELKISSLTIEDGKQVAVMISDTGFGIPRSEINKIFNPFFTARESGTGLGLSISYGIIKSHGGDIEVQSEQGKGTTFRILLPVA